jgi:hypothetical protein
MLIKILTPPKNSKESVESRRNPCYGFTIVVDIQENKELTMILTKTRDEILKIIDPERTRKQHPIHSPLYIKQKFFHASVFGMAPLLEEKQFVTVYAHEKGLLNPKIMDNMCTILHTHLKEERPSLEPIQCELMSDGTILARFAYKTESKDETPLLTLSSQLDPEKQFFKWDSSNRLRDKTVTIVLCVIDKDTLGKKLKALQWQLDLTSEELKKLNNIEISQFQLISSYNKRTLSLKHISMYANIDQNKICKI